MKTPTMTMLLTLLVSLSLLSAPALACMDHGEDWYVEEDPQETEAEPVQLMPEAPIECEVDMACPAGMLCEPVSCCMGLDCVCPPGICERPETGAQGRDCQADADCGAGFTCVNETLDTCGDDPDLAAEGCQQGSLGWCEAEVIDTVTPRDQGPGEAARTLDGCQGGQDHGLPLSVALCLLVGGWMRRRQVA